jgi:hypothetical protein
MRLRYVHKRFGALAGAEANVHITATELGQRGHAIGILHGPSTGKNEPAWQTAFPFRAALGDGDNPPVVKKALADFSPAAVGDLGWVVAIASRLVTGTICADDFWRGRRGRARGWIVKFCGESFCALPKTNKRA